MQEEKWINGQKANSIKREQFCWHKTYHCAKREVTKLLCFCSNPHSKATVCDKFVFHNKTGLPTHFDPHFDVSVLNKKQSISWWHVCDRYNARRPPQR